MLATDYGITLDSEAGYNQVHDAIYNPALPIDGAKRAELKSLIDSRFNTLNYRWEKATGKDDAWANLGIIQQAMMGG
uniref:Uncharacterized protein n=1 Tax=viral metagenome TaxID=1070528 RepID=A0A6M3LE01_9ZZZZ